MAKKNSNKQYAKALFEATKGLKGEKLKDIVKAFVNILVRNHRLKQTSRIINEFVNFSKKQEGIVQLEIKSAHKLDARTLAGIKKIFGEKIEEQEFVDKGLLGGVVIKTDDKIFDASIKTQLNKFKQLLES